MALRIDEEVCSGCELCVQICPDVFEMNSDGICRVKNGADESLDCGPAGGYRLLSYCCYHSGIGKFF